MDRGSGTDLYSFYRRALRKAWDDGRITTDERRILSELSPGVDTNGVERLEAREYFRHRWGDYSESPPGSRLPILESALGFDPENDYLWSERCAALYQLGRLNEAMESADRSLSLFSGSSEAWFWKGSVLVRRGMLDEAAECFEDALEIDPDSEMSWLMLGWTERARGDLPKAKACYDRVIDLCTDLSLGYVERGLTHVKAGDLESAQSDLLSALDIEPGNSRARELLESMGADIPGKEDTPLTQGEPQPAKEDPSVARKVRVILEDEPDEDGIPVSPVSDTHLEPEAMDGSGLDDTPSPPPTTPPENPHEVVYKWMRCPHCGDNIALTTTDRPLVITCKSCGAKGKLVR